MIEISVIIPCYNSEKFLKELNNRLLTVLKSINVTYEIIYVNDCSKDDTLNVLKEIVSLNEKIVAINLMFNVGQFRALMCGLENSRGKYIITMDDDLQHPPEEIVKMYFYSKSNNHIDAVFGKPMVKQHAWFRKVGSYFIRKVNEYIFNKPRHLVMSSFRCFTRDLVDTIISHKTMFPVMGPIILKSTNRIENIEVRHDQRKYGKSNYNFLKLIKTTMDNVINFSSLPLKCISIIGVTASIISIIIMFYFLVKYFLGYIKLPGWTSIILMVNFYSGLLLISTGIIGEYLIRILQEVNGYPKYRIRNIYRKNDLNDE